MKTKKLRIIGGQLKRQSIEFIEAQGLRPTPDRLRETVFNWLMHDIANAQVLDLCAGSGALAFEALSRGSTHATLIETNKAQVKILRDQANKFGVTDRVKIICRPAQTAIKQLNQRYDLVFLDPPFHKNLWQTLLDQLRHHQVLAKNCLIYLEANQSHDAIFTMKVLTQLKTVKVGDVHAALYLLS